MSGDTAPNMLQIPMSRMSLRMLNARSCSAVHSVVEVGGVVVMVCLSCLEVGVADVVDRWKVLEVDALLLGPILVVRSDPLKGLPSLSEVPVRVMDGEAEVLGVASGILD